MYAAGDGQARVQASLAGHDSVLVPAARRLGGSAQCQLDDDTLIAIQPPRHEYARQVESVLASSRHIARFASVAKRSERGVCEDS